MNKQDSIASDYYENNWPKSISDYNGKKFNELRS